MIPLFITIGISLALFLLPAYAQEKYECVSLDAANHDLTQIDNAIEDTERTLRDHGSDPENDPQVKGWKELRTQVVGCIETIEMMDKEEQNPDYSLPISIGAVVAGGAVAGTAIVARRHKKTNRDGREPT